MENLSTNSEGTEATLRADLETLKAEIEKKHREFERADITAEGREEARLQLIGLLVEENDLRHRLDELKETRERPAKEAGERGLAANGATFIEAVCVLEGLIDEQVVPAMLRALERDNEFFLSAHRAKGFTLSGLSDALLNLVVDRLRIKSEDAGTDPRRPDSSVTFRELARQGRGEISERAVARVKLGGARLSVEHELKQHGGEKAA